MGFILGFVVGLIVGWNFLSQPDWAKNLTDKVIAWIRVKLKL